MAELFKNSNLIFKLTLIFVIVQLSAQNEIRIKIERTNKYLTTQVKNDQNQSNQRTLQQISDEQISLITELYKQNFQNYIFIIYNYVSDKYMQAYHQKWDGNLDKLECFIFVFTNTLIIILIVFNFFILLINIAVSRQNKILSEQVLIQELIQNQEGQLLNEINPLFNHLRLSQSHINYSPVRKNPPIDIKLIDKKDENNNKDLTARGECGICMEEKIVAFVIFPCGHDGYCEDCLLHMMQTSSKCPYCRSPIQNYTRLYTTRKVINVINKKEIKKEQSPQNDWEQQQLSILLQNDSQIQQSVLLLNDQQIQNSNQIQSQQPNNLIQVSSQNTLDNFIQNHCDYLEQLNIQNQSSQDIFKETNIQNTSEAISTQYNLISKNQKNSSNKIDKENFMQEQNILFDQIECEEEQIEYKNKRTKKIKSKKKKQETKDKIQISPFRQKINQNFESKQQQKDIIEEEEKIPFEMNEEVKNEQKENKIQKEMKLFKKSELEQINKVFNDDINVWSNRFRPSVIQQTNQSNQMQNSTALDQNYNYEEWIPPQQLQIQQTDLFQQENQSLSKDLQESFDEKPQ